ncbi:MAG: sensor histidine kinase [Clostridia bacterium]|nr:sensor histidine kinase [Clostridia bacterium]
MKNKISSFFSKRNLMTQVMMVNGVVIATLAIMTFIFANYFIKNYEVMLNSQLATILEISSDSLQTTVDNIEESSMEFMVNDDLQSWLHTLEQGDTYVYEDFVASNELKKQLLELVNDQQAIKFAVMLDNDYNQIASAMGQTPSWDDSKSEIIKSNMTDGERYKWIAPADGLDELVVVRQMVDLSNPELTAEGVLVIGIDIDVLVKEKNSNLKEYPLKSLIMSGEEVLYTEFENEDDAKSFMDRITGEDASKAETRFNDVRYYHTCKELDTSGWKYAIYVERDAVFGNVERIINICVVVFIAMIFLVFYISYITTRKMVRPLSKLSKQMKKVENGVFEGVEITDVGGENEITSLAVDFNVMVKQIETLIQENYLKKMLLQESELKLLQSQINPHFLYNTLESINWMAKGGRTKEISVMVQALSKLFRSTVNNKEFVITVREELELLNNYITIQQIRFEERLEVYIDVDGEFAEYKIPKFILQPLVENSIKYALERYSTTCVIKIYAKKTENGMKLYIEDNGPGIEEAQLERIRNNKPVESKSGIALKNIRRRMEIMYHSEDAMELVSEEGKGTTIILSIPENIEN